MNTRKIAHTILTSRNKIQSSIMGEAMRRKLGPDGFQEALRRGWLLVDHESGFLNVSSLATKLEEMRTISISDKPQEGDQASVISDGEEVEGTVAGQSHNGMVTIKFSSGEEGEFDPQQVKIHKPGEESGESQDVINSAPMPGRKVYGLGATTGGSYGI